MKHLVITVGDPTLFEGDVDEITFCDSDAGVSIQGKMRRASTGGNALMQLLASATKQTPAPTQEDNGE